MEVAVKMPESRPQQRFVIDDNSKVGEARRSAQTLAAYEFSVETAGKVAIAATELANNLLHHAGSGELLVQTLGYGEDVVLELLALDRGPGMQDIARCLTDGYSTRGTPGTGLGAVKRLADEFDIYSAPGEGTVVVARFGAVARHRYGAINVSLPGEVECGDAWALIETPEAITVMLVDGLGHGAFAAEAAHTGIQALRQSPGDSPMDILQRANRSMSRTRGGAAACARLQHDRVTYAGVGNITGYLVDFDRSQGLVSHNGTLGMHQRHAQQMELPVNASDLLVMHSDGVSARWDLRSKADLLRAHPAIIAGALYRDHGRNRDDATVVVVPIPP